MMKYTLITAFLILGIGFVNAKNNPPKVYLSYSIINNTDNQEATNLSSDETAVILNINNIKIDTYIDYGSGEYIEEDLSLYLQSDISQKTYTIQILNDTQVVIAYILFFESGDREIWKKKLTQLLVKAIGPYPNVQVNLKNKPYQLN